MPPKGRRPEKEKEPSESSGEEDNQEMYHMADLARFANPNYSREFLAGLPPKVRERVTALQGLDKKYKELHEAHQAALLAIHRKYDIQAAPLMMRRREIVCGEEGGEPTNEEVLKGFPKDHEGAVKLEGESAEGEEKEKGIPHFWLSVLQHHVIIAEMITERDEEALMHLIDVTYATLEEPAHGFTLRFTFEPNEFFTDSIIDKTFILCREGDDGWRVEHTNSTKIQWKDAKNLTVKTITKKQKSKTKKGAVRYITTSQPCDSFFNFFKNKEEKKEKEKEEDAEGSLDGEEEEDEEQWYAMAQTLKDKIIPLAVEYYTGEAPDGSSDIDEDENEDGNEEDEEDQEDDEEEEEEAPAPTRGRGRPAAGGAPRGRGAAAPPPKKGAKEPPQCKQQ